MRSYQIVAGICWNSLGNIGLFSRLMMSIRNQNPVALRTFLCNSPQISVGMFLWRASSDVGWLKMLLILPYSSFVLVVLRTL